MIAYVWLALCWAFILGVVVWPLCRAAAQGDKMRVDKQSRLGVAMHSDAGKKEAP